MFNLGGMAAGAAGAAAGQAQPGGMGGSGMAKLMDFVKSQNSGYFGGGFGGPYARHQGGGGGGFPGMFDENPLLKTLMQQKMNQQGGKLGPGGFVFDGGMTHCF